MIPIFKRHQFIYIFKRNITNRSSLFREIRCYLQSNRTLR